MSKSNQMPEGKTADIKLYTPNEIKYHAAGAVSFEEGGLFVWENASDVIKQKNKTVSDLRQSNRELLEEVEKYKKLYDESESWENSSIMLEAKNKELLEALEESNLQIEYLHKKFKETGSGNSVISQNNSLIQKQA